MLFDKFSARSLQLSNRSVMAPLTRSRATPAHTPNALMTNPDLVARMRQDAPLNAPDMSTFYVPGAKGYTDYPTLTAAKGALA